MIINKDRDTEGFGDFMALRKATEHKGHTIS